MSIHDRIINGTVVEIVNPETGEIQWMEYDGGKKITLESAKTLFSILGWNGEFLFLKEEGEYTKIYTDSLNCEIAVIGTRLAKSFRKEPYAIFIKERSNS